MDINGYIYLAGAALLFLYGIFHAAVQYLVAKEAKHRDKYADEVAKLKIADNFASGIVANVGVDPDITKSESKQAAVSKLDKDLQSIGINLSQETLSRKIEAEYQAYKAAGKDTHVANTPLSDTTVNNTLDGNAPTSTPNPDSQSKADENNDEEMIERVASVAANTAVKMLRGDK